MRLVEGHIRISDSRSECRPQAHMGRLLYCRKPRDSYVDRTCSQRWRGGAHDARSGCGRWLESSGIGVRRGQWRHHPHGFERRTTYGKVAKAAAKVEPPTEIKLKDPKDWKIVGKGLKRLDTPDKTQGKTVYGIDIRLPGMLYAAIKACPVERRQGEELRCCQDRRAARA